MRANQKKSLKIVLVSVIVLVLLAGIGVGIYFMLKNREMRYFLVEISTQSSGLVLTNESKTLAPNSEIINRPIKVNVTNKSSTAFLRAKIVFSSDSDDNRVLSFVNQLNYSIKNATTYVGDNYSWKYVEEDNSFYLVNSLNNLRVVSNKDYDYNLLDKLTVPASLRQISSLNSDGENVQIGEDIKISIIFEAVQTIDLIGNSAPTIENVREHFNNFAVYSENGFTSQNGYITNYSGNASTLILPKYVGEDYIIGIKENAFNSSALQKIVVPGSYIYFNNNCFSACSNLNYVAIKSETPVKLGDTAFTANTNLEIYTPSDNLNYIKQNYSALPYLNCFKSYTTVSTNKISEIDTTSAVIYAPNVTEFEGTFQGFTKLKLILAPSLTTVNENMFKQVSTLIECDTPNVTIIGSNAFNSCTSLINASFSQKLETIGEASFFGCSSLLNANFAKSLSVIEKEAFRGCSALTSVVLEKEDVILNNGAFFDCSNLRFISIKKLTQIDSYALSKCANLRYIVLDGFNGLNINENCVENSNNALFVFNDEANKNSFKNSLQTLSNKVVLLKVTENTLVKFEGNITNLNLIEFNMLKRIEKIGNGAFKNNTTLNTIIMPSSIQVLGDNFVDGCENLTSITIYSNFVPTFTEKTFEGAKENLVVYVPVNSLEVYRKTFEDYSLNFLSIN